jgi:hypothetical protein
MIGKVRATQGMPRACSGMRARATASDLHVRRQPRRSCRQLRLVRLARGAVREGGLGLGAPLAAALVRPSRLAAYRVHLLRRRLRGESRV